jgi:hypothetical protein
MQKKWAVIFASGTVIGFVVAKLTARPKTIGNLRVDQSEPDENPYLFLELERDVAAVRKSKYVLMKVVDKNYLPRN